MFTMRMNDWDALLHVSRFTRSGLRFTLTITPTHPAPAKTGSFPVSPAHPAPAKTGSFPISPAHPAPAKTGSFPVSPAHPAHAKTCALPGSRFTSAP